MTEDELDRWTTLVVAEAHGRSLSPAARSTRRQIEREQPELVGEASLWAEFAELEQPRPGERSDAAMIAEVLARAQPAPIDAGDEVGSRPRRSTRALAVALGVAACAALGLALAGVAARLGHEANEGSSMPTLGGAAMAVDATPELRVATPGEHRLADGDCRRAGRSARLCAGERVRFRVAEATNEAAIELELDDGQLRVDTTGDELVVVRTGDAFVRARGLVVLRFDARTGALDVEVLRGEAELLDADAKTVHLGAGVTSSLLVELQQLDASPASVPTPVAPTSGDPPAKPARSSTAKLPSADDLLAAAQAALADGQTTTAIERYEELVRRFPDTDAARIASVSLGRLLLRAGRTEQALAAFDRYLDSGGKGLVEEARFGRIRALRELGRDRERDAAIVEFLAEHPGSIHRERLEGWKTQ